MVKVNTNMGEINLNKGTQNIDYFLEGNEDVTLKLNELLVIGGKIEIPYREKPYVISDSLKVTSNTEIVGIGGKPTIYMATGIEKNIFDVDGVNNVSFRNLVIKNGLATTGQYTPNKSGIYINESSNITIDNCYITEIEGAYGVVGIKSEYINIINTEFYRCTYAMVEMLEETSYIKVDNCIFDTLVSTYYVNTYTFACAVSSYDEEFSYRSRHIYFTNNHVKNNTLWEGFDCHGGSNIYVLNNVFENCSRGIMVAHDYRGIIPFEHENIFIKNNIVIKGTGDAGYHGIVVQGSENGIAKNIFIENNYIHGFGASDNDFIGGINLNNAKNAFVSKNITENCIRNSLLLSSVFNSSIENNTFKNTIRGDETNLMACRFYSVFDCDFFNNKIENDSDIDQIFRGVYNTSLSLVRYKDNVIIATDKDISDSYVMRGSIVTSNKIGKNGYFVTDPYDIKKYYCDDEVIRCNNQTLSGTLSGTATEQTLVYSDDVTQVFCYNMEIVITGAGVAGADLTTVVIDIIDENTIKIKDTISTTVVDTQVDYTECTYTIIP